MTPKYETSEPEQPASASIETIEAILNKNYLEPGSADKTLSSLLRLLKGEK